jgi:FAD/FMN-containing dehydrogenase
MQEAALDAVTLEQLDGGFGGQLLQPEDPAYDEARKVFNAMIDRRPALIARCTGVSDVMAAVRFARESDLPVAIRGGGHAVSGHAICDRGLVIDVSPMKGVRVDPAARTAHAQAGLNWGELDRETQAFGLAVTGGRVPSTGVAGLTLGGGSGWIERKCGFTCDNLVSADVVTADGDFIVANAEEHPDLFWALRGGGGNFGVVTSFEFRLHEVGPILFGGMMLFPIERAVELMRSYRDFMGGAPDEVGGASAVLTAPPEEFVPEPARGKPVFAMIVCYVGPLDEGEEALRPLRELGPVVDMLGPIPYAQGIQKLIEPGNPPGLQQYWKAGFLQELSDEAIATFVSHGADVCSPMTANIMIPLRGAVARMGEDETVLGYRDAAGWNYHILSQWADPADGDRNIEWTRRFDKAMAAHALEGLYVNFVADPPENVLERSFGPEKYARLVAVKDRYDPGNVFCFNQNVKPSAA